MLKQASAGISRDGALWLLAERLYFIMEKLDPSLTEIEWDNLRQPDKEFYRFCVEDILKDHDSVRAAIE